MNKGLESWSDELLLTRWQEWANKCVEVMAMPVKERRTPKPKGGASAEQAGALMAMLVLKAEAELAKRGLITPSFEDIQ